MQSKRKIVLLTRDASTGEAVRALCEREEAFDLAGVCRDVPSLVGALQDENIPLVLVDIDAGTMQMPDELDAVATAYPYSRFIVLSSVVSSDLVMTAMQAGARHVQAKAEIETGLAPVLHRLGKDSVSPLAAAGSVYTVLSASGGCGGTTLAVNLANELQISTLGRVLLIDLDYHYGAAATYLELHGQYGIADVLNHDGAVDPQLIATTAVRHSDDFHALLSPASIDFGRNAQLQAERLAPTLDACRQAYPHTVVDAPRVSADVAAVLAEESEATFIVMQLMVKDIRVARSMLQALKDRGVPDEKIRPVVNRYRKRHQMITIEEARDALGGVQFDRLSNDHSNATRGINFGKPLAHSAPRCALRKDLAGLATQVFELSAKAHRNGNGNGQIKVS